MFIKVAQEAQESQESQESASVERHVSPSNSQTDSSIWNNENENEQIEIELTTRRAVNDDDNDGNNINNSGVNDDEDGGDDGDEGGEGSDLSVCDELKVQIGKRACIFMRDKKGCFFQILVPLLLVTAILAILTIRVWIHIHLHSSLFTLHFPI